MVEEIRTCTTTFMRNEKLLQVLPSRGCKAFNTLLQALRFGAGQMHLVDLLTETTLTAEGLYLVYIPGSHSRIWYGVFEHTGVHQTPPSSK